jgi:hypothetical protein
LSERFLPGYIYARREVSNLPFQTTFGEINYSLKTSPYTKCEMVINFRSEWKSGWFSTSTLNFNFLYSDLPQIGNNGYDCGGHPGLASYEDGEFFNEDFTTELNSSSATSLDVLDGYAYVSFRPQEPGVRTLSVINLNEPHIEPQYITTEYPINRIDAVRDYAFVAQHSTTTQIAIFDINTGADLVLLATSTLPGVAGGRPEAVSIFYYDSRLYVGTKRTAGREFHVFDVSVPENPRWLGSREMNHNINDIEVKDGLAFLATSGNVRDMIVLDVKDPANISLVEEIDLPGNEDGRSVHVAGNRVFLGRHKSNSPAHHELHMFEVRQSDAEIGIDLFSLSTVTTRGDVLDIAVVSGKLFVSTNNSLSEIQVYELDNGRGNEVMTLAVEKNLEGTVVGVDFENDKLVALFQDKIKVFDLAE